MQLAGSCFCGAVHFTVETRTRYPYRHCLGWHRRHNFIEDG